jgi:hypothetical protein
MDQVKTQYGPAEHAIAYGAVALWGEVIEHDYGYRGQYAKVVRIMEVKLPYVSRWRWWRAPIIKAGLRSRYGV